MRVEICFCTFQKESIYVYRGSLSLCKIKRVVMLFSQYKMYRNKGPTNHDRHECC